MIDELDVKAALPLLLAPQALLEGRKRRVPRSHLDLTGDAPREVIAAQLGPYDVLVLARRGPAVLVPHEGSVLLALGLPGGAAAREQAIAAAAAVTRWQDADLTFESVGGTYALFQTPELALTFDLPAGKYDGATARAKLSGKNVILLRLTRTGARAVVRRDLELPPELSDHDFALAEELPWTTLPGQLAVVVDEQGGWAPPAAPPAAPARAGDAIVVTSGLSLLAWPIARGLLVAGSNLGDAADNVAALLAIPPARFVETPLTLEIGSGKVRLFDPEAEDEATSVKLAKGSYRVATVPRFVTAAAELVSVLRFVRI